jgi:membrane protein DedA with SNARE-associated domain
VKVGPLICAALLAAGVVYRRRRLSKVVQAIAALGCLGLLAYGSGLIDPPAVEVMIRDATRALGVYTYALVGAFAFLETGAGVGLIAPGELVVILGGVSAGQGEIELVPLVAIVWACAVTGDLTSYALGRRLGRDFLVRHGPAVGITRGRLEQVERFFDAHGGKTIILGRFVGLVRALAPFIAGASRMPAGRFIAYTTVAAGLWTVTFCLLGYAFWQSLDQLIAITQQGTLALGVTITVGVAAIVVYRRVRPRSETDRRPRHQRAAPRAVSGDVGGHEPGSSGMSATPEREASW